MGQIQAKLYNHTLSTGIETTVDSQITCIFPDMANPPNDTPIYIRERVVEEMKDVLPPDWSLTDQEIYGSGPCGSIFLYNKDTYEFITPSIVPEEVEKFFDSYDTTFIPHCGMRPGFATGI